MSDFDTEDTDVPICPYCGCEQSLDEGLEQEEGALECEECDKTFFYGKEVRIAFYTCTKEEHIETELSRAEQRNKTLLILLNHKREQLAELKNELGHD